MKKMVIHLSTPIILAGAGLIFLSVPYAHAAPGLDSILAKRTLNVNDIAVLKGEAQKIENFYKNKRLDDAFVDANTARIKNDYKHLEAIKEKMRNYGAGRKEIDSSYKKVMDAWSASPAASDFDTLMAGGTITRSSSAPLVVAAPVVAATPEEKAATQRDKDFKEKSELLIKQLEEYYTKIEDIFALINNDETPVNDRAHYASYVLDHLTAPQTKLQEVVQKSGLDKIAGYENEEAYKKINDTFMKKIGELDSAAIKSFVQAAEDEFKKNDPDLFRYVLLFARSALAINPAKAESPVTDLVTEIKEYIDKNIANFKTASADDKKKIVYAVGRLVKDGADKLQPLKTADFTLEEKASGTVLSEKIITKEEAKKVRDEGIFIYLANKVGYNSGVVNTVKNNAEKMYKDYRTSAVIVAEAGSKETAARENENLGTRDDKGYKARVNLADALYTNKTKGWLWGTSNKYTDKQIYNTEFPIMIIPAAKKYQDTSRTEWETMARGAWSAMDEEAKTEFREQYRLVEALLDAKGKTEALEIIRGPKINDSDANNRRAVIRALKVIEMPEDSIAPFIRARMEEQFHKDVRLFADPVSNLPLTPDQFKDLKMYKTDLDNLVKE